jgi:hypothetical protein
VPREDDVNAKGKGVLKTFWVSPHVKAGSASGSKSGTGSVSGASMTSRLSKTEEIKMWEAKERQTDWVVELFLDCIKKIKAKQSAMNVVARKAPLVIPERKPGQTNADEIIESFKLPGFDAKVAAKCLSKEDSMEVSDEIKGLLHEYVASVSIRIVRRPPFAAHHAAPYLTLIDGSCFDHFDYRSQRAIETIHSTTLSMLAMS